VPFQHDTSKWARPLRCFPLSTPVRARTCFRWASEYGLAPSCDIAPWITLQARPHARPHARPSRDTHSLTSFRAMVDVIRPAYNFRSLFVPLRFHSRELSGTRILPIPSSRALPSVPFHSSCEEKDSARRDMLNVALFKAGTRRGRTIAFTQRIDPRWDSLRAS